MAMMPNAGEHGDEMVEVSRVEWDALRARVAQIERMLDGRAPEEGPTRTAAMVTGRRGLLKHGALLAAATAAGAAAMSAGMAQPAGAATADDLALGQVNQATASTSVNVSGSGNSPGFGVTDDPTQTHLLAAAVAGYASNDEWGTGVLGVGGANAYGVSGSAGTGVGVYGVTSGFAGVWGLSQDSGQTGVYAVGDNPGSYGLLAAGRRAAIGLGANPTAPSARTDAHTSGEIDRDESDTLWFCVADGTPGPWVRLAAPGSAGAFTVLSTSVRVYDSRPGQAPTGVGPKSPLIAGTARAVDVTANSSGVPVGATAVFLNLTVVTQSQTGYLSAFKAGTSAPGTSNLNWAAAGTPVANAAVVAVGTGHIDLQANASTDVIVDVIGYYQ